MKKLVSRLIWIPAGAVLVVFLVANRRMTPLSLDPFNAESPALATPALPLWVWLALALLLGVAAGAAGMWMSGSEMRKRARDDRRELKALKHELAARPLAPPEGGDSLQTLEAE